MFSSASFPIQDKYLMYPITLVRVSLYLSQYNPDRMALEKNKRFYKIAKAQSDYLYMTEYAKKIMALQYKLGIGQAEFPELGLIKKKE